MPQETVDVSGVASAWIHITCSRFQLWVLWVTLSSLKPMLVWQTKQQWLFRCRNQLSQGVQPHRLLNIRNKPVADRTQGASSKQHNPWCEWVGPSLGVAPACCLFGVSSAASIGNLVAPQAPGDAGISSLCWGCRAHPACIWMLLNSWYQEFSTNTGKGWSARCLCSHRGEPPPRQRASTTPVCYLSNERPS